MQKVSYLQLRQRGNNRYKILKQISLIVVGGKLRNRVRDCEFLYYFETCGTFKTPNTFHTFGMYLNRNVVIIAGW